MRCNLSVKIPQIHVFFSEVVSRVTRTDFVIQWHQLFWFTPQNDQRMQTKEVLSTSNSKQTQPQSCPETSSANSRLVREKGGFLKEVVCLKTNDGYIVSSLKIEQKIGACHHLSNFFDNLSRSTNTMKYNRIYLDCPGPLI